MEKLDNSFALIIGVYDPKLGSTNDATDIHDVLIDKDIAGYKPENVILLTEEKATRKGILDAFDDLVARTNIDSKVLLYYSGHGAISYEADNTESYYLEAEGFDSNTPNTTGVKGNEIREKLNEIIAERLIFFFDCCHAQGMTEGPDLIDAATKFETLEKSSTLNNPEGLVHDVDDEEGMAIISSCKDDQKSLYFSGDRNSLFTAYLLKVLKGEHKTHFDNEYIKVLDVAGYLVEEVPKDAARDDFKQNPFVNLQIDKNFELSKVPKSKLRSLSPNNNPQVNIVKKEVKKVFRESENANSAIIFVHGFSGEAHESFGKMPELFMNEVQLDGWDMFPFGFNANVKPEMGKEIWATVNDIKRIGDNLSSAIKYKFKKYDRIAIVGYSLGGLVAQRAILDLDNDNRNRISHLLLFATPSNGITNNAIKNLWKNKIHELVEGQRFITSLRMNWTNSFRGSYPFIFKTVTATKDDFVTADSSFKPFNKKHWVTVSGNHFSIVNIDNKKNDTYNFILNTLTDNAFFNEYTNQAEINLVLGEYNAIIRELEPKLNEIDERGLENLIDALECTGRDKDAEHILKTHPIAQNDADMLNLLGDLYKRKYLDNSKLTDGKSAFNCYTKALALAHKNEQTEQICKNSIDLAFLNLMLEEDYKDMKTFANIAIKAANEFSFDKLWKLRALAEGNLYLNNLETSNSYYEAASIKAPIKEKIEIYRNAYTAYSKLNDIINPEDVFLGLLKLNFLS